MLKISEGIQRVEQMRIVKIQIVGQNVVNAFASIEIYSETYGAILSADDRLNAERCVSNYIKICIRNAKGFVFISTTVTT